MEKIREEMSAIREEEQRRRTERLAAEAANRQRRESDRQRLDEELRLRAEQLKKKQEDRENRKKRFLAVKALFTAVRVRVWRDLPKNERLGVVDGTFYCMCPRGIGPEVIYMVQSSASGNMKVTIIHQDSEEESMDLKVYQNTVAEHGCVFVSEKGGKVYLVPLYGTESVNRPVSEDMSPTKVILGEDLCQLVTNLRLNTDGLHFNVKYVPADGGSPIFVKRVGFGQSVSKFEVQQAVVNAALRDWRPPKTKRPRRTVELYDGKTVTKSVNGVTYVPRNPTGSVGASYHKLYEEAIRQEALAAGQDEQEQNRARETFCEKIAASVGTGSVQISIQSATP